MLLLGLLHPRKNSGKKDGKDQRPVHLSALIRATFRRLPSSQSRRHRVRSESYWSGKLLTPERWKAWREGEVGEGQQVTTESLAIDRGPLCFSLFGDGYSAPPQMLSPLLPCRPLLFASQWIYSPPYLILIKAPFSLPPQHNQLKKNELVSHCFYHFGSKRMLCLARSAPSQKMNQQLLWQKLFPEWGNRDKKKTGQGEVSVVGIASPPPPRGTSLPLTGEGSPAAGGASPSAPKMAAGPGGAILWAVLAGGSCPQLCPGGRAAGRGVPAPWQGAGGSGKVRATQIPAGLPESPVSARQVVGRLCRPNDRETLICPRTALWHGLPCAHPWEKDELFLCVLMDLDPYLAVLSGNLARIIHSMLWAARSWRRQWFTVPPDHCHPLSLSNN